MRRRLIACTLLAGTAVLMTAPDAAAQQTLNLSLGYFAVRGQDERALARADQHSYAAHLPSVCLW